MAFWDDEQLVGEVPKGRDVVQVRLVSRNGKRYVDVRAYWEDGAGERKPGKGIALPVEIATEVTDLVTAALKLAEDS